MNDLEKIFILSRIDDCHIDFNDYGYTTIKMIKYDQTKPALLIRTNSELEYFDINDFIKDIDILPNIKIESISIFDSISYEDFEDIDDTTNINDLPYGCYKHIYLYLIKYYHYFNSFPTYSISPSDDCYGMCPFNGWDFEILISKCLSKKDIAFIEYLENQSFETIEYFTPKFVKKWYCSEYEYDQSKLFNILQTQTKIRRLGYLKFIFKLFDENYYYPKNYFSKLIELKSNELIIQLDEYQSLFNKDNKGRISITKNGTSSVPYLDILKKVNLITEVSGSFILSKYGKIYLNLIRFSKYFQPNDNYSLIDDIFTPNIFVLNNIDKAFFLYFLFKYDSFYLWALFEMIFVIEDCDLNKIKLNFQDFILNEISDLSNTTLLSNSDKQKLLRIYNRIKNWKKKEKYLEHLIEPRINWLLDLGLIDNKEYQKKKIKLSCYGFKLFGILASYSDSFLEKYVNIDKLLENNYFEIINNVFQQDLEVSRNIDNNILNRYLEECFVIFKTLAPNKINAVQSIYYIAYMFYFKEKKIVEINTLKKHLMSDNDKFSLEWYKSENDGSIIRKKVTS